MLLYTISLLVIASSVNAISGGHDTNITRHKWQLSLQHNNEHFCGAVLIGPTWALTSAGCVQLHPSDLSVRAGSSYKSSGGQLVDVQTIVVHPDYNAKTRDSDIALLQFSEEMDEAITLTVKMPAYKNDVIEDNKGTTLTGWGSLGNGTQPELLQMLNIPVTPTEKCQSAYPDTVISLNMFCVGWMMKNQDRTACEGDYGGPGIIEAELQGIISWGNGCGVEKYPTVLTRVGFFMPWIIETTGIDFPFFPDGKH